MKVTGYFVLYEKSNGELVLGMPSQTPECALESVHPNEKAKTYGPYSFEIDTETHRFDRKDVPINAKTIFGQFFPKVE